MRLLRAVPFFVAGIAIAPFARADGESSVAAQSLFDEGKKLAAAERWPEACGKFAESQRLDPGVGTQYHLADCYEHVGRRASAWAIFREIEATTRKSGEAERADITRARADALEAAGLPKLVIVAPPNAPRDLVVTRDGVPVGAAQLGAPVPIDEGEHIVEASAPGKKLWRGTVQIAGIENTVSIPALADAPRPPSSSDAQPKRAWQRPAAFGAAGVGVVALGVGSIFGLRAMSKHDESLAHCQGSVCDSIGLEAVDAGQTAGTVSTIAFGVGAAAIVGAAVLWFTAPSKAQARVGVSPFGVGGVW